MDDLNTLYARYDGPPPYRKSYITSPACWELMLRAHLRAIRLKRHHKDWALLPELTDRLKEIRQQLVLS